MRLIFVDAIDAIVSIGFVQEQSEFFTLDDMFLKVIFILIFMVLLVEISNS